MNWTMFLLEQNRKSMAFVAYHKRLHTRNKPRRLENPSRRHANLSEIQSVNCIWARTPADWHMSRGCHSLLSHATGSTQWPIRPPYLAATVAQRKWLVLWKTQCEIFNAFVRCFLITTPSHDSRVEHVADRQTTSVSIIKAEKSVSVKGRRLPTESFLIFNLFSQDPMSFSDNNRLNCFVKSTESDEKNSFSPIKLKKKLLAVFSHQLFI